MDLAPVERRSLPDEVFERLAGQIVTGGLAPGGPLPSERHLADALGVSRPAVREALQRLAQAGLVEIRQGETTTVRDYRRYGGIDLLPRLLLGSGTPDLEVLRSIVEARLLIGPEVAALAAGRTGPDGASDRLRPALHGLQAARATSGQIDAVAAQRAALEFWDGVVDLADSIVFRLLFNGLRASYEPALDALAQVMRPEVEALPAYLEIATAIGDGDPAAARSAARALLERGTAAFAELASALEEPR